MPRFRYEVKIEPGRNLAGVVDAESERAALAKLREMGYVPISLEESDRERPQDARRHVLTRIRLKDRNVFFRQLANLFESGMPLARALATLTAQTPNPKMAAVIARIREDIQRGDSFADALERHPGIFSPVQCSLVRAGESGGMLDEVLWRIVALGEQQEEIRGKAFAAMVYPLFLLITAAVALFILVSFVFPKFTKVFVDFDVSLPWITVAVMAVCGFMERFWWTVFPVAIVVTALIVRLVRSDEGRKFIDARMLGAPVIGDVVHRYQMAQFARIFGTLLDNGMPVLSALRITAATLGNKAVAEELDRVQERVAQGAGISDALQSCRHFPPMVVSMFAIGEESGRLGSVAKRMAEAYDNEVDRAVRTLTALLEPAMILLIGSVIGVLVIAMLLPMLTLSAHVS